jgi:hypothetical protein
MPSPTTLKSALPLAIGEATWQWSVRTRPAVLSTSIWEQEAAPTSEHYSEDTEGKDLQNYINIQQRQASHYN